MGSSYRYLGVSNPGLQMLGSNECDVSYQYGLRRILGSWNLVNPLLSINEAWMDECAARLQPLADQYKNPDNTKLSHQKKFRDLIVTTRSCPGDKKSLIIIITIIIIIIIIVDLEQFCQQLEASYKICQQLGQVLQFLLPKYRGNTFQIFNFALLALIPLQFQE